MLPVLQCVSNESLTLVGLTQSGMIEIPKIVIASASEASQ